jgi:hypothetical protein
MVADLVRALTKAYAVFGEPWADPDHPYGEPRWSVGSTDYMTDYRHEFLAHERGPSKYWLDLKYFVRIMATLQSLHIGHVNNDMMDSALSIYFSNEKQLPTNALLPPLPESRTSDPPNPDNSDASEDDGGLGMDEEEEDEDPLYEEEEEEDAEEEYEEDAESSDEEDVSDDEVVYCDNPMCCHCACDCRLLHQPDAYSNGRRRYVSDQSAVFDRYLGEGSEQGLSDYVARFRHGGLQAQHLGRCHCSHTFA